MFLSMCEDIPSGPMEVLTLRELNSFSTSSVHWVVDRSGRELEEAGGVLVGA